MRIIICLFIILGLPISAMAYDPPGALETLSPEEQQHHEEMQQQWLNHNETANPAEPLQNMSEEEIRLYIDHIQQQMYPNMTEAEKEALTEQVLENYQHQ